MPEYLPAINFTGLKFSLNQFKAGVESFGGNPFTQTFNNGLSDKWSGVATTAPMSGSTLHRFWAWLTKVGMYGEFYMYNLDHPYPENAVLPIWFAGDDGTTVYAGDSNGTYYAGADATPGNALVNGVGQTGANLVTDGWHQASTKILDPGDFIGVQDKLYMVTAEVTTNASNQATIPIVPNLRSSPADNAAVITHYPKFTAYLLTPPGWETNERRVAMSVSFNFQEKL